MEAESVAYMVCEALGVDTGSYSIAYVGGWAPKGGEADELAACAARVVTATATNAMVAVAGIRWRIEECNEQGKDLIGLDQHQVRTRTAFHHHVAVCVFTHAFAATGKAALRAAAQGAHRGNDPATSPAKPRRPVTPAGGN